MVDKLVSNSVPLPIFVDDEHMDKGQPSGCPPVVAFYINTLEVFEIMAKVMQNSASLNRGFETCTSPDQYHLLFGDSDINHLTETLKLDQSLMNWASSLPSHLRADPVTSRHQKYNPIFHRQANVLRSRYIHTRILLFRPILSRFCLAQPDTTYASNSSAQNMEHESLPQHLALACSNLCLRAAHDAIHLIYSHLDRENITGPVPQWWNCILFTYSAATVLQAARLRPMSISSYNIDTSWTHALEIIRSFEPLSPLVQRCLLALEILADKITETTNGHGHGHDHSRSEGAATTTTTATATGTSSSSSSRTATAGTSAIVPDPANSNTSSSESTAPTAVRVPTPTAPRWTTKDERRTSPMSAPSPTPGDGDGDGRAGTDEAANAVLPGMDDALDVASGAGAGESGSGHGHAGASMGLDFDLNDMSWLTSTPVNL